MKITFYKLVNVLMVLLMAAILFALPLLFQAPPKRVDAPKNRVFTVEYVYGDLDGDGALTIFDLALLKRAILDPGDLDDLGLQVADVNGDQILDAWDGELLTAYLHGKIDFLPAGDRFVLEYEEQPTQSVTMPWNAAPAYRDETQTTDPPAYSVPELVDDPDLPGFITPPIRDLNAFMPTSGEASLVVFYVDFPDCRYEYEPDLASLERLCFSGETPGENGYPFESIAAYYQRSSKGNMRIKGTAIRYTAQHPIEAYADDAYKLRLIVECYKAMEELYDFSDMDSDHDGRIDATIFNVPAAAGNENWWPCAGPFGEDSIQIDGLNIGYVITGNAQIDGPDDHKVFVSRYCHELGHCMGLPDYYLYVQAGEDFIGMHGVAGTELMDADAASDLSCFSKLMLGFYREDQVQVYDVSNEEAQTFTLLNAQSAAGNCLIIPNGKLSDNYNSEYFIVEYMTEEGNQSGVSDVTWWQSSGVGVRVFHVSAEFASNGSRSIFRYQEQSPFASGNGTGRRLMRIIDDTETDNYYRTGDVIDSEISGFHWYDNRGLETVEPELQITVGEVAGEGVTVTVSRMKDEDE